MSFKHSPRTSIVTCVWRAKFSAAWPAEFPPEIDDLLHRIDSLLASGGDVLLFRKPELYHMTDFVNRHTQAPVRFVGGLSMVIRAFEDIYGNLEGKLLEALSRLLVQNVRIHVYPMSVTDLREWLKSVSANGWEWSETNGWVSASELRRAAGTSVCLSSLQRVSCPDATPPGVMKVPDSSFD